MLGERDGLELAEGFCHDMGSNIMWSAIWLSQEKHRTMKKVPT